MSDTIITQVEVRSQNRVNCHYSFFQLWCKKRSNSSVVGSSRGLELDPAGMDPDPAGSDMSGSGMDTDPAG